MACYVLDDRREADFSGVLPLQGKLKDGTLVVIDQLRRDDDDEMAVVMGMLNGEIEAGTYPQDSKLDMIGFMAYYCSHDVFVLRIATGDVIGATYVKPNFPGRCSHICNGGFLVRNGWRGRGAGRELARAFEVLAPVCGFEAAFFNLVFEDNPASIALWDQMGYQRAGRVPDAKSTPAGDKVSAIMFYKKFRS